MVVCKYFMEGNCRFGATCRNDHIFSSKYSYQPSNTNTTAPQLPTAEQLVKQVQTDTQAALKGNQWLLSVYAPFKEKPNYPGLKDHSMEEIRLLMYEAKANNKLNEAIAHYNLLVYEAKQKFERLLEPTPAIVQILQKIYKGETASMQSTFSSQTNAASSLFASAAAQNTTSSFGQQNTNSGNIFGQNNATNQNNSQNVFGQSQSVFGGQQAAFGNVITPQQSTFTGNQQQNVFASNQSVFSNNLVNQQQIQPNAFGNQQSFTGQAQSIFAQANQELATPQAGNVFADASKINLSSGPETSAFASTVQKANPFLNPATNALSAQNPVQQQGSLLFQGVSENTSTQITDAAVGVYSDDKDVSAADMEEFNKSEFRLGFIPIVAPPRSVCF